GVRRDDVPDDPDEVVRVRPAGRVVVEVLGGEDVRAGDDVPAAVLEREEPELPLGRRRVLLHVQRVLAERV
ncbi:MAG: hypothetical protein AVDCRST_MAG64-850, partial [uncultured Phycisphaerae bacterium]